MAQHILAMYYATLVVYCRARTVPWEDFMGNAASVSLAVFGTGATFEEASSSLTTACADYLRKHGESTPDHSGNDPTARTANDEAAVSASQLVELEDLLTRRRWPVESWRRDLELWVSAWKPRSREITKFIVSDYPRTAAWDTVEAELHMTGPRIGGFMSSPSQALNALFPGQRRETLVERSYATRRYVIHPIVVAALREALA
jgi:hypothetical protein